MPLSNSDLIPAAISPTDVIIPIMGTTGAGKSTFIQLCTKEKVDIGHGLMSCTAQCMMYSFMYNNHVVRLIDTPGFDDSTRPEIDILAEIALWLNMAYTASPRLLLSGLVYLHPIHEPKMQGSAKRNLNMFRLLCGNSNLDSVVLATTMWEKVTASEGEKRLQELVSTPMFWGEMIDRGSHVVRHKNNEMSARKIIDFFVSRKKAIVLDIQREMVDSRLTLEETSAGREQLSVVLKDKRRDEQRLHRNEEELTEVLRQQDQEEAALLQAEQARYKKLIEERKAGIAKLKMDMETLRRERQAQWKKEEEEIAQARKQHEAKMAQMRHDFETLAKQQDAARVEAEAMKRRQDYQAQQSMQNRFHSEASERQRREEIERLAQQNQQAVEAAFAAQQQALKAQQHQQRLDAQRQQMQQQMYQMQQHHFMIQQAQAIKMQQQSMLVNGLSLGAHLVGGITSTAGLGMMGSAAPGMVAMAGMCNVM